MAARHTLRGHRPFATRGVSLSVVAGDTPPEPDAIVYRPQQLAAAGSLHGERTAPGGAGSAKTGRVAFAAYPATSVTWPIPAELAGKRIRTQLRTCQADIENETTMRTVVLEVDDDIVAVPSLGGTATLLSVQPRQGGVCRVQFRFVPSVSGIPPESFSYQLVSGAVTAAIAPAYNSRKPLYQMDLTCSSTTVVDVTALAQDGDVEIVLFRATLEPDTTGPAAPSGLTGRAV